MKMSNLLLIGGAAVAAYFLFSKKSVASSEAVFTPTPQQTAQTQDYVGGVAFSQKAQSLIDSLLLSGELQRAYMAQLAETPQKQLTSTPGLTGNIQTLDAATYNTLQARGQISPTNTVRAVDLKTAQATIGQTFIPRLGIYTSNPENYR